MMETNGFDIFFQEDEEDYLDDPISLLDFEEDIVFSGSEKYFRNITIEDPGYVVNISVEDYELQLQKTLSKLKELKKLREISRYFNNNGYLLRKCRNCSIKVVDCLKFPWYYRNKLTNEINETQYPNIDNNVEIEEKHEEEIMIIDLTDNEQVECKNHNDNVIQEEYTSNIEKNKTNRIEFTSVDNSIDGKVEKQTYKTLFKPVLDIQNEIHTKLPRSQMDQAKDLLISTYTTLTDKAIQKIKNNIESCEHNKNISHNLGKNLSLGCESFTKTRGRIKDTKDVQKVVKVSTYNINDDCEDDHHKKKNNNKLKDVYTSEQISKTKIKIKKSLLKSKEVISSKKNCNEKEDKGCNLNVNATCKEQYDSLKYIDKKNNSLINEEQRNPEQNCNLQNKQQRVQRNSYSYLSLPSPVLTKIITKTKNSTSLSNRNKFIPNKIDGCNKQVFSVDRTIPHFHDNAFLNSQDFLSKTKSNTKYPKRSKDIIKNYQCTKNKNRLDFKALNIGPVVTQTPNPNIQRIHDCTKNNNAMVNNKVPQKKKCNSNVDISNILTIDSLNPSQFTNKIPVNNGIILKRSAHAFPNVVKENVNKIDFINQSKKNAAQEEERFRYLLPSNMPDTYSKHIFK